MRQAIVIDAGVGNLGNLARATGTRREDPIEMLPFAFLALLAPRRRTAAA